MTKQTLGKQESKFFAYVQMRGKRTVQTGEIAEALELSNDQVTELFRRLSNGGLIARIRPGLYLAPQKLPMGGSWTPDEGLALDALMKDRGGTYQVCGPNAFNRYGFIDQVPTRVYAYNDQISGERTIGSIELSLIKVDQSRLGGIEKGTADEGSALIYSSRTRTLIDAVYGWSRFNCLPQAYRWIRRELSEDRIMTSELIDMAITFGNIGTRRRVGYLLDLEDVNESELERLERKVTDSSSYIPWDPTLNKKGSTNKRWGIVDNREEI